MSSSTTFIRAAGFVARAVLTAGMLAVSSGHALAADAGCGWASEISTTANNRLFIDASATYWSASIPIPQGAAIEVAGIFPYAAYLSLAVYDARGRTIDHVTDRDIVPDPGARNPFVVGATRSDRRRSFTLEVVDRAKPEEGEEPNRLYTSTAAGGRSSPGLANLTLRIYAPEWRRGPSGGVPLPEITTVLQTGERVSHPSCLGSEPPTEGAGFSLPGGRGSNPPDWEKFEPNGLGENIDNSYVYETFMPSLGEVLVLHAQAPTSPFDRQATHRVGGRRRSISRMGTGQVRYWSMCSNRLNTAVFACLRDDEVPVDKDGNYTIVVSRAEDRPRNAKESCGVAWLEAVPDEDTILVYRHMLPDASFPEAIQNTTPGAEEATMGVYYPGGTYYDTALDFEALGCRRRR